MSREKLVVRQRDSERKESVSRYRNAVGEVVGNMRVMGCRTVHE